MIESTAQNVPVAGPAAVDRALLEKYDTEAPRYTSYPSAARFTDAVPAAAVEAYHQNYHTARLGPRRGNRGVRLDR